MLPINFDLVHTAPIMSHSGDLNQNGPLTWHNASPAVVNSFDPQRAIDDATGAIANLFLGLTQEDPLQPGTLAPALATTWSASADGLQWTFTLRNDVPWVRWNPVTDKVHLLRMVTAHDAAYGLQRVCDPRQESPYTKLVVGVIRGCDALAQKNRADITVADYDLVHVVAQDDTTLVVTLQRAAGYFPNLTALPFLRPVPRDIIEAYGQTWAAIDTIATSGPFVLDEHRHGIRRVFLRNPLLPDDLRGPGNVARVVFSVVPNHEIAFRLFQQGRFEMSVVPSAKQPDVLADPLLSERVQYLPQPVIAYIGLAHDKTPTSNPHVRRAFSAMIDRELYQAQILQTSARVMTQFTPPDLFGAPSLTAAGVGYDLEFAQRELALAGYPNCEGLPNLTIFMTESQTSEFFVDQAVQNLGCDPEMFTLELIPFSSLIERIDTHTALEERPHIWFGVGWAADYPDAHNFMGDLLHCQAPNPFQRACSEVDAMIDQAGQASDPRVRSRYYTQIEVSFFWEEGAYPVIPLYVPLEMVIVQPWVKAPPGTNTLVIDWRYDWYVIEGQEQTPR